MSDTLYPAPFITLSVEDLLFIVEGRYDKYSSVLCDDILPLNRTRKIYVVYLLFVLLDEFQTSFHLELSTVRQCCF